MLRTLLMVLLLGAAMPALAEAPEDNIVWFAGLLGVPAHELPAAWPMTVQSAAPEGLEAHVREASLDEVARLARQALPATPRAPVPASLGLGASGDGTGVGWTGFAVGSLDMECIALEVTEGPEVPPTPLTGGGDSYLLAQAALPEDNVVASGGTATMMVQVLPTPSAEPSAVPASSATGVALLGASMFEICYPSFTLRISVAGFAGDGAIAGMA